MDWQSIPLLVTLRKNIDALIEEHVEPGNPEDCVTCEYIMRICQKSSPKSDYYCDRPVAYVDKIGCNTP